MLEPVSSLRRGWKRLKAALSASALALAVAGCASGTDAMVETLKQGLNVFPPAAAKPLDPQFQYLRTTIDGRVLFLVLGYLEKSEGGDIETWYSGAGEVIQLQNGRIRSTAGLGVNWRNVTIAPEFGSARWPEKSTQYRRRRDVTPGHVFGIREQVILTASAAPVGHDFQGPLPDDARWYRESVRGSGIPVAWFAVRGQGDEAKVIFSRQCLSPDLCLSFQPWEVPAAPVPPLKKP